MNRRVVISGCSGGGKSTLVTAFGEREFDVVTEPGRRIVVEETASGGTALPWVDGEAFARRAIEVSRQDIAAHALCENWVFFDRGLVDASSALASMTGTAISNLLCGELDYFCKVFLVPPWEALFQADEQRRHSFTAAVDEYQRLLRDYSALGYEVSVIPQCSVAERLAFVLEQLDQACCKKPS